MMMLLLANKKKKAKHMQCPVCSNQAVDIGPKSYDGKVLWCSQCKDYEISGTFLLKFLASTRAERGIALDKAKRLAASGVRPSINSHLPIRKTRPVGARRAGFLECG
jgi:hypothetical protein